MTNLDLLYLNDNNFNGGLPTNMSNLTDLDRLEIQNNNFDREVDPTHNAVIPSGLTSWYNGVSIKSI